MRVSLPILVVLAVAAAGCNKPSSSTTTTTGGETTRSGSTETTSHESATSFDGRFVDMMVPHHEQGIMMAKMALDRAEHDELRKMASKMIAEQKNEITQLKSWRKQWFGSDATPPLDQMATVPGMESHPKMNSGEMRSRLEKANPFDREFIDLMLAHHEMAVHAAELAQTKAKHTELRDAAAKSAESQKKDIDELKRHRAEWYASK